MEVTINLPDRIYSNVESLARKTHRRVDEIIAEKIEKEFSFDIEELKKQVLYCSDKEILLIAKIQMPPKPDRRLSFLLQKQGERNLTVKEQSELGELMELNRITDLKKAFAMGEAVRRGLNDTD